jgi:hypothetical protein
MPALIGTIALLAGCGSSSRTGVTGVVRDARTGRAIAGARVVASDGAATRTDADGRFLLSVSPGAAQRIRVSAPGRCAAHTGIDVRAEDATTIEIELAPRENASAAGAMGLGSAACGRGSAACGPDAVLRWIADLDVDVATSALATAPLPGGATQPASTAPTPAGGAWTPVEQWALGTMQLAARGAQAEPGCATCHDAAAFAAAHGAVETVQTPCGACHDPFSARRYGLRIYEDCGPVAGAEASGLGSGAICVACHASRQNALAHAPQADVLLGRGARLARASGPSAHGAVADTCVACHAAPWRDADPETITLGHTFAVRDAEGAIAPGACSACHGDVAPTAIGAGDWDGDGIAGAVAREHERAVQRARRTIERRIRAAAVRDARCATRVVATGFVERAGLLLLTDEDGAILGDCDRDGVIEDGERAVTIDVLPPVVRDAAWDLAMIERDGSRGVHHPEFAFAVLSAISSAL